MLVSRFLFTSLIVSVSCEAVMTGDWQTGHYNQSQIGLTVHWQLVTVPSISLYTVHTGTGCSIICQYYY